MSEQVAIVTGGASGIGHAISHALAREGAAVVIGDLDEPGAQRAADEIAGTGGRASACRTDVARAADAEALVAHAVDRYGRLDILVNNAGYCQIKPFMELTEAELDQMHAVHVRGTFLCSQAAARRMIARGYGRIVNIVSGGGHGGSPWTSHYQAAKAAQASLGRGMALALIQHGITVNNVSPGLVVTALWQQIDADYRRWLGKTGAQEIAERTATSPLGRVIEAEEVAHAVLFLALPESAAINGQIINVSGSTG